MLSEPAMAGFGNANPCQPLCFYCAPSQSPVVNRKGLYEIIFGFFLVVVLVFGVLFMLSAAAGSSELYAKVRQTMKGANSAGIVKDELLSCHRLTYLDAELFSAPCRANALLQGYSVRQLPLNGCPELVWDFTSGEPAQKVPFVVAIEQENSTRKCLAILEVGE